MDYSLIVLFFLFVLDVHGRLKILQNVITFSTKHVWNSMIIVGSFYL